MNRKTSIDVYRKIRDSGILSERRWEAYAIVYRHGPLTSNEVFEYSKLKGVPGYRHNTNARMTELRDMGAVEEIGTKCCSVTGEVVILWDVTDKFPVKLKKEKHKSKNAIIAELRQENEALLANIRGSLNIERSKL